MASSILGARLLDASPSGRKAILQPHHVIIMFVRIILCRDETWDCGHLASVRRHDQQKRGGQAYTRRQGQ